MVHPLTDTLDVLLETETRLGGVRQRARFRQVPLLIHFAEKVQRLADRLDRHLVELSSLNEFIQAETMPGIAAERLWQRANTVFPGKRGESELGTEPVTRIVGVLKIGLEKHR